MTMVKTSVPAHTGAATFAVTLAPDGKTLYAVNAGANSVAVIRSGASTPIGSPASSRPPTNRTT